MDEQALEMAMRRIALAREGRDEESRFEAALRRSREEVEALAAASSSLVAALPGRVSEAVEDGLRREVVPVARNLGEIRGLLNNTIGRLERIEQDLIAERNARLDDLALLVELVSSGWRGVDLSLRSVDAGLRNIDSDLRHVDVRLQRIESGGGELVPLRGEQVAAAS